MFRTSQCPDGSAKYNYLKSGRNPWQDPYWYRTEITLPKSYKGKKVWLTLYGINYRADVWINGRLVADKNDIVGMFRRFKLDITDYALPGANNCVAVKDISGGSSGCSYSGYPVESVRPCAWTFL